MGRLGLATVEWLGLERAEAKRQDADHGADARAPQRVSMADQLVHDR